MDAEAPAPIHPESTHDHHELSHPMPRRKVLGLGVVGAAAGFALSFLPTTGRSPFQVVEAGGCGGSPTGDCHAHCACYCQSGKWDCWALFYDPIVCGYYAAYPCCKNLSCGPCDGRFLFDCTPCGCSYCTQFNCQ